MEPIVTQPIQDIALTTIDNQPSSLADHRGKVLLLVNVASKCGLTPQYEGLQKLYLEKNAHGLEVLGFPANNFLGQEPGSEADIQQFCQLTYDVSFPMFAKISVAGDDVHPLYQQLIAAQPQAIGEGPMRERLAAKDLAQPAPGILWNFEKFLVGRDGQVVARFAPDVTADDPRLREAIDAALAA
nr:glutathione peroxidase [Stenotrophomonas tumulicola]